MELEAAALVYYMSVNNYIINLIHYCNKPKPRLKRRCWMKRIQTKQTLRTMKENIMTGLLYEPSTQFEGLVRMSATDFEILLQKVAPLITKQNTRFRDSIPAKVRLAVTLRYLTSGESFRSLHEMFKMSHQVISTIVRDCCLALHIALKNLLKVPGNEEEWLQKASQFSDMFPHCLGVLDGRNISITSPMHPGAASAKLSNLVLLALVDRNFCFTYCDVEDKDGAINGSEFSKNILFQRLHSHTLNLPKCKPLSGGNEYVPYVFVANDAFPLHVNVIKPFLGEHPEGSVNWKLNCKISSVRIVVENALGIMTARFRVLQKPITLFPGQTPNVVMACALLHNFLMKSRHSASIYTPTGYVDTIRNGEITARGNWRREVNGEGCLVSMRPITEHPNSFAVKVRNKFVKYFNEHA